MTVLVEKSATTLEDGIKTLIESAITDYKKRYGDGLNTDVGKTVIPGSIWTEKICGTKNKPFFLKGKSENPSKTILNPNFFKAFNVFASKE